MEYGTAKEKFIQAWGTLGSSWGINKAMAQIHALLLVATEPLSAEDIMEELKMSRGNVNMNLRALMDWGIVMKQFKVGERREFFTTGKDIGVLARQIARERKKRELEPILQVLAEVKQVKGDKREVAEFKKVTSELHDFSGKVNSMLETFSKSDQNWFLKLFMRF